MNQIECNEHGTQESVISCHHLCKQSLPVIFLVPSDPEEPATVWCSTCEDARIHDKGWFDYADEIASWKLICTTCLSVLKAKAHEVIEFEGTTTPNDKET